MSDRLTVYGDLASPDSVALTTVLVAKGLAFEWVDESPSLSFALATRTGSDTGPYLRTRDGVVLADLHVMLDWIERVHPEPALLPTAPVRRTTARVLEEWIELWLPSWPRRSWSTLERIGRHLTSAGYLLGPAPSRADWLLAAWLETEVLIHDHARVHLARTAPRLVSLGTDLLSATPRESLDDVLPISLLPLLGEIAGDYHGYLVANHRACKDHADHVLIDLGLGRRRLPVRPECETRRAETARELAQRSPTERKEVRRVLEPVGAWYALTLPPVIEEIAASDPRSL